MKRGIKSFDQKVNAITGAGSGIGKAAAILLASRGSKLAISDFDAQALIRTKNLCNVTEKFIYSYQMDVSDEKMNQQFASNVIEKFGKVDMYWCNAGIAHVAIAAWKMPIEVLYKIMNVNIWGMVNGSRAFLPHLLSNFEPTSIVTTISSNGIIANGFMSRYTASKFAIRGWYESLAFELNETNVKAYLIFPGGVNTNIAKSAICDQDKSLALLFSRKMLTADPNIVSSSFLDQILSGKTRIFGGARSRLYDIVSRIWPYHLYEFLQNKFGQDLIKIGKVKSGL